MKDLFIFDKDNDYNDEDDDEDYAEFFDDDDYDDDYYDDGYAYDDDYDDDYDEDILTAEEDAELDSIIDDSELAAFYKIFADAYEADTGESVADFQDDVADEDYGYYDNYDDDLDHIITMKL